MDETLTDLFQQWLTAFERTQAATGDEETVALLALTKIESRIAATPAEGSRGLVVKFGLDRFLSEHTDTLSEQADSGYADLVRLTGHDSAAEIAKFVRVPATTNRNSKS